MSRSKKVVEDETIEATWLATYSDLVTLLLCFFILLFAMSTIDNQKFKQFIISFQSNGVSIIGDYSQPKPTNIDDQTSLQQSPTPTRDQSEEEKFQKISEELKDFVNTNGLDSSVSVYHQQEGVLIRFNDSVLFDKGQAYLKSDALKILGDMVTLLYRYERMVKVEGHTDNDPISSMMYPSNWELSTARAVNVVKFFIEGVPPELSISPSLLQAAGYGEYHPLVVNDSEQNKAKNRRIEIIILKNTSGL